MRAACVRSPWIGALLVCWPIAAVAQSGIEADDAVSGESIDRAVISDWLNSDCSSREGLHGNADEDTGISFCRCFSDYLSELLTTEEMAYLATYSVPTEAISEKAERATLLCSTMQGQ